MSERLDNLIHEVGRLAGRLEALERVVIELPKLFIQILRRADRKRSRNGGNGLKIPYSKLTTIIGLIILGALMQMSPEAVKASIAKLLFSMVGGS